MASETVVARAATTPSRAPSSIGGSTQTDDPLARAVGLVLRWGVWLAAAITAAGGAVLLRTHGSDVPRFRDFVSAGGSVFTVTGALRGAAHGNGAHLIETGLLVLIATPVARVVMLLAGFWRAGQWLYVTLSAVVLGALTVSLMLSR
jgi:uncharacterized membrane protein